MIIHTYIHTYIHTHTHTLNTRAHRHKVETGHVEISHVQRGHCTGGSLGKRELLHRLPHDPEVVDDLVLVREEVPHVRQVLHLLLPLRVFAYLSQFSTENILLIRECSLRWVFKDYSNWHSDLGQHENRFPCQRQP